MLNTLSAHRNENCDIETDIDDGIPYVWCLTHETELEYDGPTAPEWDYSMALEEEDHGLSN